jgi:D-lyxose ketol-isomerase
MKQLQVWGPDRKKILARFDKKIRQWGITMPKVMPMVSNFGINEFDKTGLIEYWVSNEEKQGYCGKYLFVFNNQSCPEHSHKHKHETFFVVKGKVRMKINGKQYIKNQGYTVVMPPNVKHSFTGYSGDALLLEVSTPCIVTDNYFTDKRIAALFK